ncbi:hypothetical protein H4R33_000546 [Dimargaris cristalligena]|uniref:Chitin-binding type-4 domain-containing protein n=1 Tax=Dimargaris cristalligena TaxID=215637 RepID=A0A4Q0A153_9FUNG|nr:hypothetical protein H4R33_000546 [Dimargaris cristalligena]RKP39754.1 hypothetical protein BJ085DRAFT_34445 [Dimargaris cristalligena]|eukprot:RKP39754.1 hypothetical protein BJ085DRAFT_34445 [Dimargaris cristalligena]
MWTIPRLLTLLAGLTLTVAHSQLGYPIPRSNGPRTATCGAGLGCKGPCESLRSATRINDLGYQKVYVARGQKLKVQWKRANHPGGFVRLALVPIEKSDSWDDFNTNVLKHSCYESHCGPDPGKPDEFGYGNGVGGGDCWTEVEVPAFYKDETVVTLQWIWYGGGVYYAQPEAGFGEYYNCADIVVKGGTTPTAVGKVAPVFEGKDYSNPTSNVCKYWSSNQVGVCSFAGRMPSPKSGDLLSESLEPCARGKSMTGKPAGF